MQHNAPGLQHVRRVCGRSARARSARPQHGGCRAPRRCGCPRRCAGPQRRDSQRRFLELSRRGPLIVRGAIASICCSPPRKLRRALIQTVAQDRKGVRRPPAVRGDGRAAVRRRHRAEVCRGRVALAKTAASLGDVGDGRAARCGVRPAAVMSSPAKRIVPLEVRIKPLTAAAAMFARHRCAHECHDRARAAAADTPASARIPSYATETSSITSSASHRSSAGLRTVAGRRRAEIGFQPRPHRAPLRRAAAESVLPAAISRRCGRRSASALP